MTKLRVDVGDGPLSAEYQRLLRTALRRGEGDPEAALAHARLEGEYDPQILAIACDAWLRRMLHEHHSATIFSRLLPQLIEAEVTLDVKAVVLRMSMDELRHASLCAGMVRLLDGEPEIDAELKTDPLPRHEDAGRFEAALRNALFAGLSETVALALLTEERELATEPAARAVLEQLAADEVLHAKLGWGLLTEARERLDAQAWSRLDAYLPIAFGTLEMRMHEAMPLGPPRSDGELEALEALGAMESREGRVIFARAMTEVVIPRLAAEGLEAERAWADRRLER
ncbi:MAG: ferritin-like domain-containing protein [Deltaproteobacteria bacterium]|nr:ferritin-like domain-containing protein [Deltaproteobacteria bacterium]